MFKTFVELKQPRSHRPTLLTQVEDGFVYDPFCEVVLFALSDTDWNGRWQLDEVCIQDLLSKIELFNDSWDKVLSIEEILKFISEDTHKGFVRRELPSSLHGMLGEELVRYAFSTFDKDSNNALDKDEFTNFLVHLKDVHLQYLLKSSFQVSRAFFGRGQSGLVQSHAEDWDSKTGRGKHGSLEAPDDSSPLAEQSEKEVAPMSPSRVLRSGGVAEEIRTLRLITNLEGPRTADRTLFFGRDSDCRGWAVIPPGWLADLYYYSANYHPLHGIIGCDPSNLLSSGERLAMELATIGFLLFTTSLYHFWVDKDLAPHRLLHNTTVFGIAVITIPSMVMFQVLVVLFTCPRLGFVNVAKASRSEVEKAKRWTRVGECLAYGLILFGLGRVVLLYHSCLYDKATCTFMDDFPRILRGRLKSYIVSWVLMLLLGFNPVVAWGQVDPEGKCSLGDYIGLGQWRIEKMKFKFICHRGVGKLTEVMHERRCSGFALCGAGKKCHIQ